MFPLFESIRIQEGNAMHLEWHQRRMDYAFHMLFGRNNLWKISDLLNIPIEYRKGIVKCRLLYSATEYRIEYASYTSKPLNSLKLIECNTIDYSHKYSNRNMLNDLFEKKGDADDILVVRDGQLTDTSYCNIVFFDGRNWSTPEEPLLEGTARNRLLAEGLIRTDRISPGDLKQFVSFRLINAMLEFGEQKDISIHQIQ